MPSAEDVLKSELEDIRKKLAGYDDVMAQEERSTVGQQKIQALLQTVPIGI